MNHRIASMEGMVMYPVSPMGLSSLDGPSVTTTSCSSPSSSYCWSRSSSFTTTSSSSAAPLLSDDATTWEQEEQLVAMLVIEQSYRVVVHPSNNHLQCCRQGRHGSSSTPTLAHEEWRRKICEWCYKVVDHFGYDREITSVAMNYFDRYLARHLTTTSSEQQSAAASNDVDAAAYDCHCPSCQRAVDSRTFQLAAMASLYLAIKIHAECGGNNHTTTSEDQAYYYSSSAESASHYERRSSSRTTTNHNHNHASNNKKRRTKRLKLSSFVDLSRGQFTPQDLVDMERSMLEQLEWKVNPTTPMSLCTLLLKCMPDHNNKCQVVVPTTTTTSLDHYYAQQQDNYDLVLHVINELSRYMTELSVCLAHVSTMHTPSQVAYASVLIAIDMMTETALPHQVRQAFYQVVAHHGAKAATNDHNCNKVVSLLPNDETILYLKTKLQHAFLPEMLMMDDAMEHQHPIRIAREAGLLELKYVLPHQQQHHKHQQQSYHHQYHLDHDPSMHEMDHDNGPVCVTP